MDCHISSQVGTRGNRIISKEMTLIYRCHDSFLPFEHQLLRADQITEIKWGEATPSMMVQATKHRSRSMKHPPKDVDVWEALFIKTSETTGMIHHWRLKGRSHSERPVLPHIMGGNPHPWIPVRQYTDCDMGRVAMQETMHALWYVVTHCYKVP